MAFIETKDEYKIWVFAPFLDTEDPNLQYYCDYSQSIAEYTEVFAQIGCDWEWMNITMNTIDSSIQTVKEYSYKQNIVLNLCDGDETNGVPGISVILALDANQITYTGSDAFFYQITTSKIPMKRAFDQFGVSTPAWLALKEPFNASIFKTVGIPAILKPAVSAGSMGLGIKNVVNNTAELESILIELKQGYRGWTLDSDGLILEQFIKGREFTTLVVGSSSHVEKIQLYEPAERVFHQSLPDEQQFLSFDRLWETYDEESPMPEGEFLYEYADVKNIELSNQLKELSLKAFKAVKGMGYARLDIRMNKENGQLLVLEINAQCGLSEDENYTSIGAILRFSQCSFTNLVIEILEDALRRKKNVEKL